MAGDSMRQNFLGVYGHVVLDYIFRVPKLPEPNTTVPVRERRRYFGGTAGNIARAAGRLGVRVAIASFVGQDFPKDYLEALQKDGVDTTDLLRLSGWQTPTAWIFSDPEGNQVAIIDQGPMQDPTGLEILSHAVENSQWVHIGTGRPQYYERVVRLAKERGKRVAFDPSQEIHYVYDSDSFLAILQAADLFFGNVFEFRRALGFLELGAPEDLLRYVEVAILTRGRDGSEIYTSEGTWQIPCVAPGKEVDVTGAGDAYRAGFYAGLSRGLDLPWCGLLGAATASFCIEGQGPQDRLPTWEEAFSRAKGYEKKVREKS